MALGLVIGLGVLSLLSGTMEFLFGKPKLFFLKSNGEMNFAFGFKFNHEKEPTRFDTVQVRLFNPFGKPSQVDITRSFDACTESFSKDLDMGPAFQKLLKADGINNSLITITISSSKDGITFPYSFKGPKFLEKLANASETCETFEERYRPKKSKALFQTVNRSFIADPLPATSKQLKIATNPAFAGDFAATGATAGGEAKANYSVSKVWIEPGCIVCDACETIYPEVFEVKDDGCIVRSGYPQDNGLQIQEAAEACPVEVIKFVKA